VSKPTSRTRFTNKSPKVSGTAMLICRGAFVSILVSFVCILFLSLISLFTENTYVDHYVQYIMVGVTMVSIFIGSVYATKQSESKGLIIGMFIGVVYILISIGCGMEITHEYVSVLSLANKFLAGMAAGILGALLGVNL